MAKSVRNVDVVRLEATTVVEQPLDLQAQPLDRSRPRISGSLAR
jgi:hypothetical protein